MSKNVFPKFFGWLKLTVNSQGMVDICFSCWYYEFNRVPNNPANAERMNIDTIQIARILERFIFCCKSSFILNQYFSQYSKVKLYKSNNLIVGHILWALSSVYPFIDRTLSYKYILLLLAIEQFEIHKRFIKSFILHPGKKQFAYKSMPWTLNNFPNNLEFLSLI